MSADNITDCPKCYECTLRENYGIGMTDNGVLEIEYHCLCWDCKWEFEYKKDIKALDKNVRKARKN